MAGKAEVQQVSGFDTVKLICAVLLLSLGVIGFYYFAGQSTLYRVLALLAVAGVAVAIASSTVKGQDTWHFLQSSRTEVRKMVWPTRAETVQTTLIVLLLVILVGVFLWLLDTLLGWGVESLLARG